MGCSLRAVFRLRGTDWSWSVRSPAPGVGGPSGRGEWEQAPGPAASELGVV